MLQCILLEKTIPRPSEGRYHDGFHLHFPHFVCEGWFQDHYLRVRVSERMVKENVWAGCEFFETAEKLIDPSISTKVWLMYGSAKARGAEPYLATHFFDHKLNETSVEQMFEEELEGRKSKPAYYLPRFLSIRGYDECVRLTAIVESRKGTFAPKKRKRTIQVAKNRSDKDINEDYRKIVDHYLMEMLSDDRADNYDYWMEVGWCLYNIGQGDEKFLQLWIDFSQRSPKYKPGECEDAWTRMECRGMTMGSLRMWAKKDSPEDYVAFRKTELEYWLEESLREKKPNEWDVAQVIKIMYQDRFRCTRGERWYEFRDHRWREMINGEVELRLLFPTEVSSEYMHYSASLIEREKNTTDLDRKAALQNLQLKCAKMRSELKSHTFHNSLVKMCKLLFHDPNFFKKADENRMLFGCENGVLDLETLKFREGRPDDYITKSCGLHYKDFDPEDDDVNDLKEYLNKVFVNKNIQDYFVNSTACCLQGGNLNKKFYIHTGIGNNAKSVTFILIEHTFGLGEGGYVVKFPRELFVLGKANSSGGPRPELARFRGARIAEGQEIGKNEAFNVGLLKEMTGNDTFFARTLNEKGSDIRPQMTIMMCLNEPPHIPGHDDAMWNRLRMVPYESCFIPKEKLQNYPVPDAEADQYKQKRFHADNDLVDRIPELAQVFLWYLFQRYKEIRRRGGSFPEPDEVKYATDRYRSLNDIYMRFISDRIIRIVPGDDTTESKLPFLSASEIYGEFISWYHENHSYAREKFAVHSVTHELEKKLGPTNKRGRAVGWYGCKINDEDVPKDEVSKRIQDALNRVSKTAPGAEKSASKKDDKGKSKVPIKTEKKKVGKATKIFLE
jgi:phage/plasmid-associated DNA primase